MISTVAQVKEKLALLGIQPKKSLGQNFLISENVISKIVKKVELQKSKKMIEIGPGLGALTESLISLQLPLTILELDSVFANYWRAQSRDENLVVVECDALQWEGWSSLIDVKETILVSNLPYQISSSIVIDRSVDKTTLGAMVLMFQKEVAQRIKAKHQTEHYGLLSVIAQTFWEIENLVEAGPKDFFPPPQIASRVLYFCRRRFYTQ
jgi:16S rRNA (adenine1518-N6/adenine1519-N6)-dimethyltransferase